MNRPSASALVPPPSPDEPSPLRLRLMSPRPPAFALILINASVTKLDNSALRFYTVWYAHESQGR
jgi:hypothetical protein